MRRTPEGATLIGPETSLPQAAALPGLPRGLQEALAAALRHSDPDLGLAAALTSGAQQRLTTALLVVDARLRLDGPGGTHEVPLDDRLTLDGRVLPQDDEALAGIVIRAPTQGSAYRESARDEIGVAARIACAAGPSPRILGARVVWWGLAPAPFIGRQLEGVLQGRAPTAALLDLALQTARSEAQPAGTGMELDAPRLAIVGRLCGDVLAAVLPHDSAAPA